MTKHISDLAWMLAGIAMFGGAASVVRFLVSDWIQQKAGSGFPWGTFAINAFGCLLFGILWAAFEKLGESYNTLRIALLAGVCGALTTFSTFAFDTTRLIDQSAYVTAFIHVLAQTIVGVCLVFFGIFIVKWIS